MKKKNNNPEFISSSHFLITKKLIQKIGGFNEQINSWEDVDFSFRSKIFNTKMIIESNFEAIHHKNYNFLSNFQKNNNLINDRFFIKEILKFIK